METNKVDICMELTDEYIKELKDKHKNIGGVIQLRDVRELVMRAHRGQVQKYTVFPYYIHQFTIADDFTSDVYKIVASSCGLIGNTKLTLRDLEEFGYSEIMIRTIDLLTHGEDKSYLAHLINLAPIKIARRIKMADIEHTLYELKFGNMFDKYSSASLIFDKYSLAIHILGEYERRGNNG